MEQNYFSSLLGNSALTRRLSKDINENTLSHAYILEGPRGSGRHTMAKLTVAALSCDELRAQSGHAVPCGSCRNCKKILEDACSDIKAIGLEGDKVTIGVEAIRLLKEGMYTAPSDLAYKVYIIEDADKMTVQAQNAFLLSLEEPPSYILFFLICENAANLLETVRSRAPTLRMEPLPAEQIKTYLLQHDKRALALREESEAAFERLVFCSEGSLGKAIELLDAKKRKALFDSRDAAESLLQSLASKSRTTAFSAVLTMGSKRPEVIERLTVLQIALRDLILLKKSEEAPLCFFENRERAADLSARFTSTALFSLYDASAATIDDLEMNANLKLSLMSFLQSAGLI